MNEIMENGVHVYSGEIDEEDDSSEIREIRGRGVVAMEVRVSRCS